MAARAVLILLLAAAVLLPPGAAAHRRGGGDNDDDNNSCSNLPVAYPLLDGTTASKTVPPFRAPTFVLTESVVSSTKVPSDFSTAAPGSNIVFRSTLSFNNAAVGYALLNGVVVDVGSGNGLPIVNRQVTYVLTSPITVTSTSSGKKRRTTTRTYGPGTLQTAGPAVINAPSVVSVVYGGTGAALCGAEGEVLLTFASGSPATLSFFL